jgi:hypothetical protein
MSSTEKQNNATEKELLEARNIAAKQHRKYRYSCKGLIESVCGFSKQHFYVMGYVLLAVGMHLVRKFTDFLFNVPAHGFLGNLSIYGMIAKVVLDIHLLRLSDPYYKLDPSKRRQFVLISLGCSLFLIALFFAETVSAGDHGNYYYNQYTFTPYLVGIGSVFDSHELMTDYGVFRCWMYLILFGFPPLLMFVQ